MIPLDHTRTVELARAVATPVRDHLVVAPASPQRVLEALNAIATAAALVLAGIDSRDRRYAREFLDDGISAELGDLRARGAMAQ